MIQQNDAISAREGTIFVTIDNETFEIGEAKSIVAEVELSVADVQSVGQRMLGGKVVGGEGTGSLTYHFYQNRIRKMIAEYVKNGRYPDISIKCSNADVSSRAGRQTVLIKGVIFTKTKLFELDGTSDDTLEDETDFRFNDFDMLENFKPIL